MLIENYTGEPYKESGQRSGIEAKWDDNGTGRGEYRCQITLETRTGSDPLPGPTPGPIGNVANNNEDGEDITVSWRVVAVEVEVTKSVDTSIEL